MDAMKICEKLGLCPLSMFPEIETSRCPLLKEKSCSKVFPFLKESQLTLVRTMGLVQTYPGHRSLSYDERKCSDVFRLGSEVILWKNVFLTFKSRLCTGALVRRVLGDKCRLLRDQTVFDICKA